MIHATFAYLTFQLSFRAPARTLTLQVDEVVPRTFSPQAIPMNPSPAIPPQRLIDKSPNPPCANEGLDKF